MSTHQSPQVFRTSSEMSADTQSVSVPVEHQRLSEVFNDNCNFYKCNQEIYLKRDTSSWSGVVLNNLHIDEYMFSQLLVPNPEIIPVFTQKCKQSKTKEKSLDICETRCDSCETVLVENDDVCFVKLNNGKKFTLCNKCKIEFDSDHGCCECCYRKKLLMPDPVDSYSFNYGRGGGLIDYQIQQINICWDCFDLECCRLCHMFCGNSYCDDCRDELELY